MPLMRSSGDELALIGALGLAHFPKLLVCALRDLLSIDHLSIVRIDKRLPHVVLAESVGPEPLAKHAAKIYESSRFRRSDPNVALLNEMTTDMYEPVLFLIKADEIEDGEYRSKIYSRFHLVERLSIIHYLSDSWYALNLYRTEAVGGFTDSEIDIATAKAGLMTTLVAKHLALGRLERPSCGKVSLPSISLYEYLVGQLDGDLTARQIEVCARALMGMTNRAIAIDLGIEIPTVATLRKRAYRRLNISSLSELFALCLSDKWTALGVTASRSID
jgi:DNA-binding CsgD family transcriptional regulator